MSKKIYVIDDDPDMTKVMAFRLKDAGFETVSYSSGKEGFDAISNSPPDLIILDIQMPDMTGDEIEKRLNENDKTKNVPIIFLTGKTDLDTSTLQKDSNRALLLKPCDFDELIRKINEMTGSG